MRNEDILIKEIDLIQSCINRMANNSFSVKGWAIAILTAVIALFSEKLDLEILCVIGIISSIIFWSLDSYYLKIERLYRWKYEWVINNRPTSDLYYFDLNPHNSNMWCKKGNNSTPKEPNIIEVMCSSSEFPLYLTLLLLSAFILILDATTEEMSIIISFFEKIATLIL